jgi:hypothetical protein
MTNLIFNKTLKNILNFCLPLLVILFFVAPSFVHAQSISIPIPNPLKNTSGTIPDLINTIIDNIVLPIGGVVAALMVMYAGFLYVTARGDTTKIKKAHEALWWAVIGAGILLGSKVIATAIQGTISKF